MQPYVVRPARRQVEYALAAAALAWLTVLYVGALLPGVLVLAGAAAATAAVLAVLAYALSSVTVTTSGLVVQTGPVTREVPWERVAILAPVHEDGRAAVRLHSVDGVSSLPAPRSSRWLPDPGFDARAAQLVESWRRWA